MQVRRICRLKVPHAGGPKHSLTLVGCTADVPDLAVEVRPLVMYCLDNRLPRLHLLLGPDAGGVGVPGGRGGAAHIVMRV
jgi:hypothetical protein